LPRPLASLFGRRQQIVKLDRMAEAIAQLNAEAKLQLVTVATTSGFYRAVRVRTDQTEIAVNLIEEKLVSRSDCLGRWSYGDE
jgi:hypothetical protein